MSNHSGKIPKWLTNQYLEKMLQIYFGGNSLHIQDSEITPGSNLGDNYACQIFRIKLQYTRKNENETRFIIAKVLPKTELAESIMKDFDFHGNEAKVFKKTLWCLKEELEKAIGKTNPFFPELLHVDEPNSAIFMDDLKQKGYQLADRLKSLDLSHCLLVMKALASLHASSFLLLKKDPNHKDMYLKYYWSNVQNDVIKNLFQTGHRCLVKFLPMWPISEEAKTKLRNLNPLDIVGTAYQRNADDFNLLVHGDCWMNNMMFKHNNGIVEDVKLLDYQLVNYNAIGLDLNYFLFTSASEYVKMNHINDLLSTYYETFVSITGNIENFSLDIVHEEFRKRSSFGFLVQFYFRPGVLAPKAFDLDAQAKGEQSEENEKMYLNEVYIKEASKLLPLFEKNGVL